MAFDIICQLCEKINKFSHKNLNKQIDKLLNENIKTFLKSLNLFYCSHNYRLL